MPRRAECDIRFKQAPYRDGMSAPSPIASTVEIARIKFKFGNLKQVRIPACRSGNGFRYQITKDGYEAYDASPRCTSSPLTLGELVGMIEDCVSPRIPHGVCREASNYSPASPNTLLRLG